jgi:hypothetical protein
VEIIVLKAGGEREIDEAFAANFSILLVNFIDSNQSNATSTFLCQRSRLRSRLLICINADGTIVIQALRVLSSLKV